MSIIGHRQADYRPPPKPRPGAAPWPPWKNSTSPKNRRPPSEGVADPGSASRKRFLDSFSESVANPRRQPAEQDHEYNKTDC